MSKPHYTEEFRLEAIRQVTEKGHSALQVAERLGISPKSMYDWLKKYGGAPKAKAGVRLDSAQEENRRLKAELKRVTEERDILKKAALSLCFRCGSRQFSGDGENPLLSPLYNDCRSERELSRWGVLRAENRNRHLRNDRNWIF